MIKEKTVVTFRTITLKTLADVLEEKYDALEVLGVTADKIVVTYEEGIDGVTLKMLYSVPDT